MTILIYDDFSTELNTALLGRKAPIGGIWETMPAWPGTPTMYGGADGSANGSTSSSSEGDAYVATLLPDSYSAELNYNFSNTTYQRVGINFNINYVSASEHTYYSAITSSSSIVLYKYVNGTQTLVASGTLAASNTTGTMNKLEIRTAPGLQRVYVNDICIVTANDTSIPNGGNVGFRSQSSVRIFDFKTVTYDPALDHSWSDSFSQADATTAVSLGFDFATTDATKNNADSAITIATTKRLAFNNIVTAGALTNATWTKDVARPDHYVDFNANTSQNPKGLWPIIMRHSAPDTFVGIVFQNPNVAIGYSTPAGVVELYSVAFPATIFRARAEVRGNRIYAFVSTNLLVVPTTPLGDPAGYEIPANVIAANPALATATRTGFGYHISTAYANGPVDNYASGALLTSEDVVEVPGVVARSVTRPKREGRVLNIPAPTERGKAEWVEDFSATIAATDSIVTQGWTHRGGGGQAYTGVNSGQSYLTLANSLTRTNLFASTQNMLSASWTLFGGASSAVSTIADKFLDGGFDPATAVTIPAGVDGGIRQTVTLSGSAPGNQFAFSIYVAVDSDTPMTVSLATDNGTRQFRSMDFEVSRTPRRINFPFYYLTGQGATSHTLSIMNGTGREGGTIHMWGAQVEIAKEPTDYKYGSDYVIAAGYRGSWTKEVSSANHYVEFDVRAAPSNDNARFFPGQVRVAGPHKYVGFSANATQGFIGLDDNSLFTSTLPGGSYPFRIRLEARGGRVYAFYGPVGVSSPSTPYGSTEGYDISTLYPEASTAKNTGVGFVAYNSSASTATAFADNMESGTTDAPPATIIPNAVRSVTVADTVPRLDLDWWEDFIAPAGRTLTELGFTHESLDPESDPSTAVISANGRLSFLDGGADLSIWTKETTSLTQFVECDILDASNTEGYFPLIARAADPDNFIGILMVAGAPTVVARHAGVTNTVIAYGKYTAPYRLRLEIRADRIFVFRGTAGVPKPTAALSPTYGYVIDPTMPALLTSRKTGVARMNSAAYSDFADGYHSGISTILSATMTPVRGRSRTRLDEIKVDGLSTARILEVRSKTKADFATITVGKVVSPIDARSPTSAGAGDATTRVEIERTRSMSFADEITDIEAKIPLFVSPERSRSLGRIDAVQLTTPPPLGGFIKAHSTTRARQAGTTYIPMAPVIKARSNSRADAVVAVPEKTIPTPSAGRSATHSDESRADVRFWTTPTKSRSASRADGVVIPLSATAFKGRSATRTEEATGYYFIPTIDGHDARSRTIPGKPPVYLAQKLSIAPFGSPPCSMIEQSGNAPVVLGPTRVVDGYPYQPRSQHWVSVHSSDFTGRVVIEAALGSNPNDGEWVTVFEAEFDGSGGSEIKASVVHGRLYMMRAWVYNDNPNNGFIDRVVIA